ncbi:MAG: serine/threonine protein kinase, partial [Myxococcales bacterium]|nr:serine/threonine protein kinase [Myxococcales bacterium]
AIKVLARKFSVDPEMVSRFVAEARAVNQIRNRHIIDIFSFGQLPDGRHYYVMEYLDGETLDALIERESKIAIAELLPILRGIAKALDAAHAKGIAHRDLKAENVFLGKDGDGVVVKLLDFGIAKLMASDEGLKHKTRTGVSIGTPYYMSPEQARGKEVDHRTDLYAFGVLVYLALTGTYPFDGDDFMTILMAQCSEEPEPPSKRLPSLPASIDAVVLKLMQKDPADRPSDLKSAVRALEEAADQAGIATMPPTSAWDAQTGPALKQFQTRPPNVGSAQTVASASADSLDSGSPKSRTKLFMGIGGVAAVAIGIAVMLAMRGDHDRSAPAKEARPTSAPAPAPTPAPIPAASSTPAPPPSPAAVIVTIAGSVPEGTDVRVGAQTIGVAPGPVQLPRGDTPVVLTFKAEGYLPVSKSVVPDKDQPLAVVMRKKPHAGGAKTTKDDIIDVFGGNKK